MKQYKHILVPVDFSNGSQRAVEQAQSLATHTQATLSLLAVVEPLPAVAYSYMGSADIEEDMLNHSKQQLAEWGQQYNINAENQHILNGHPKTEIAKAAEDLNCDLIVIGSHGHHGILSHLLGSTSESVAHHAKCDVLIVRKPDA